MQVYAHKVNRAGLAHDEPDQKLVGYARVEVAAESSTDVNITLDPNAYRTWDLDSSRWTQWTGEVELRVGTSSRHIAHRVLLTL